MEISKIINFFKKISPYFPIFLFSMLALPILILLAFGLYSVFLLDYKVEFFLLLLGCTVLSSFTFWVMRNLLSQQKMETSTINPWVEPSREWTDNDREIWKSLNSSIKDKLEKSSEWRELYNHSLGVISAAAQFYHETTKHHVFAFNSIEMLIMIEEISRRYRLVLKNHVPYIEKVNLSTLLWAYDHKDKYDKGKAIWNVYRVFRAFTPEGLLAETRSKFVNKVFGDLTANVQFSIKQAFLQEVASVAIDLYSGRFKVGRDDLSGSTASFNSESRIALNPEPLRIGLLGQVSSGKSSIVNALIGSIKAEVGQLPTTTDAKIYSAKVNEIDVLHLFDLQGLDGCEKNNQTLLKNLVSCDVILWVLKANQSARSLDVVFKKLWDDWFSMDDNKYRKRPIIIGILNQVDRLPPIHEWQPPYDFDYPDTAKAIVIKKAIDYNRELLGFDVLMPLSLKDGGNYNFNCLQEILNKYYEDGLMVQLNRRRLDLNNDASIYDQFVRACKLGEVLFNKI